MTMVIEQCETTTDRMVRSKILCVDDELLNLKYMRQALVGKCGPKGCRRVPIATNAEQALEVVKRDPTIGVVVTDIKMNGHDGVWLARQIHEYDPTIIVVAITAHADLLDPNLFCDVFFKPIDRRDFRDRLCDRVIEAA